MPAIKKLFALFALLLPLFAHAAGEPYTQEKFDALNHAGKPTLVFIYADWCPTCRAQDKVLNELLPSNEFKNITALSVNFDSQKPVMRNFSAQNRSTIIVFKSGKEVARMTAETDRERIATLLRQAL